MQVIIITIFCCSVVGLVFSTLFIIKNLVQYNRTLMDLKSEFRDEKNDLWELEEKVNEIVEKINK